MSNLWHQRRPRLAYPFTILTARDTVRLIAGEDYRYTLTAPELNRWLPDLLRCFVGKQTLQELVADFDAERRQAALHLVQQLFGERVLVDGTAHDAHAPARYNVTLAEGSWEKTPIATAQNQITETTASLVVLWQDRLDYEAALACQRSCRAAKTPMLWVSHAALARAYVSPLFLPDAGPCFGCLFSSFHRLSPAPEIYDALREHARAGRSIEPVDVPEEDLLVLRALVHWKLTQAELEAPDPALYRLHVLEREHFEVSTHRVFADPFCPECGKERT